MISCNSLKKTKFCMNCKHFFNNASDIKFGKCSLFPREDNNFLVSGELDETYHYASLARKYDDMCGKEAKLYKRKYKKRAIKIIENKEENE